MSTKAFSLMLLVVVVLGGIAGGALFAFSGHDTKELAIGADSPTATPLVVPGDSSPNPSGAPSSESNATPDGAPLGDGTRPQGARRFAGIEPIAGTLAKLSPTGIVVTSRDTGADAEIIVPAETPVRLSETAGDTTSLIPGAEIVAFLQRNADGAISVTNVTIGGFGGGRGALGGYSGQGGIFGQTSQGNQGVDGTEFNAVPGTITSFAAGALTLQTNDGPIDVTVADDTPVQLTIAFADLADQLAIGSDITIIGQRNDAGIYTPIIVASGTLGGFGGAGGGFGGGGRRGQRGDGTGVGGVGGAIQIPQ
jgi:hypothetical protein